MARKSNPKFVFIDTNIFMKCAAQEEEQLNLLPLENLLKKMDDGSMMLLLPKNIERETQIALKTFFTEIREIIAIKLKGIIKEKIKEELFLKEILEKIEKVANKETNEKIEKINSTIEKIFKHKETKKIEISDTILIKGIRRSVLKMPPVTIKKRRENQHTMDQDCIAFEAILEFLKKDGKKIKKLCICSDDSDYKLESDMHPEIVEELKKLDIQISYYNNPLLMLEKEFKKKYTPKQIDKYEEKTGSSKLPWTINDTVLVDQPTWPYLQNNPFFDTTINIPNSSILNSSAIKVCETCGVMFKETSEQDHFYSSYLQNVYSIYSTEKTICPRCKKGK